MATTTESGFQETMDPTQQVDRQSHTRVSESPATLSWMEPANEVNAEPTPGSHLLLPIQESTCLTEYLWGLRWAKLFPRQLAGEICIDHVGYERALPFIRDHYSQLFASDKDAFLPEGPIPPKERYLRLFADCFLYTHQGRDVGLVIFNPKDWSTYYLRTAGFLQEYQGKHLYEELFAVLLPELARVGVKRMEAETAPSNSQCLAALIKQDFNMTGSTLSERWGATVQFTKFLDQENESVFLNQFCPHGGLHIRARSRRRHGSAPDANGDGK